MQPAPDGDKVKFYFSEGAPNTITLVLGAGPNISRWKGIRAFGDGSWNAIGLVETQDNRSGLGNDESRVFYRGVVTIGVLESKGLWGPYGCRKLLLRPGTVRRFSPEFLLDVRLTQCLFPGDYGYRPGSPGLCAPRQL